MSESSAASTQHAATFTGLVDLAAEGLGGKALGVSDDFFAGVENLLKPGRAVFIAGKFTERGKWMDGWESRRKRTPGHDWCVLELGVPGQVLGFDIDTQHFVGNHPAFALVEGTLAPAGSSLEQVQALEFRPLLDQVPLRPNSQNLFAALQGAPVSHVRLSIFPDGGVARFRVFGRVSATWASGELDAESQAHVAPGAVDLAALKNGAVALACSDAHFGPMNNLLLPGRALDMGGGWETRRNRAPGHDWVLLQLAARGSAQCVEIDTHHFKGNYPDRCSLDVLDAAGQRITELIASESWRNILPESKLQAHTRHFFKVQAPPATHLRVNIFPDGGISRVRVWGQRV